MAVCYNRNPLYCKFRCTANRLSAWGRDVASFNGSMGIGIFFLGFNIGIAPDESEGHLCCFGIWSGRCTHSYTLYCSTNVLFCQVWDCVWSGWW